MTNSTVLIPRRTIACVLAVAGLSLALGAESASADTTWAGTIQSKVTRSSRWVSAGTTARGDFFITVDDEGRATGNGVVSYTPEFSSGGLDALIGYAKSAASTALAGIPFLGPLAGSTISSFVSVNASYDPMVVREGSVSGTLQGDRLSLTWGGDKSGVPFRASILAIKKDVKLTSGRIVTPDPLRGAARVVGGNFAVATGRTASTDDGVTEREISYWTAHRVG